MKLSIRSLFVASALAVGAVTASACAAPTGPSTDSVSATSDLSVENNYGGCPVSAPQSGVACHSSLQCMYGSDPRIGCRTMSTCTDAGWQTTAPSCSKPAPACPSKAPVVKTGISTCTDAQDGLTCVYGDMSYTCAPCNGDMCLIGQKQWFGIELDASCPKKAPDLGASCVQEGVDCNYGHCMNDPANPTVQGMVMSCTNGTWAQNNHYWCIR